MALRLPIPSVVNCLRTVGVRAMSGEWGSGAGKGGGTGGSIREAGGSLGKMEAAHEEEYFRRKQAEQIEDLRAHLDEEVSYHQHEIENHKEAIRRHKEKIGKLKHQEEKMKGSDSD